MQQYFDKYFRGRLKFDSSTRTPLQDFLAGNVDSGFQYFGDSTRILREQLRFLLPGQLSPHTAVDLNYGLRWDYFGVVGEKNNLLSNITSVSGGGDGHVHIDPGGQPG